MMKDWKGDMDLLYQLFEQEASNYHRLIKEMKIESKWLREGDTDSLMKSVRSIEERIKTIRIIEEEIRRTSETILNGLGKGERDRTLSCLSSLLPPTHQARLSSYQKTLNQLKAWAGQINDQNTTFIREYMAFLSELISPLIGRWSESTGYPGHKSPSASPSYALNREV